MKKIASMILCCLLVACESPEQIAAQQRAREEFRVTQMALEKAERERAFEEQLQRDIRRKEAGLSPEKPVEDRQQEQNASNGTTSAIVGTAAVLGGAYVLGKILGGGSRR